MCVCVCVCVCVCGFVREREGEKKRTIKRLKETERNGEETVFKKIGKTKYNGILLSNVGLFIFILHNALFYDDNNINSPNAYSI